MSDRTWRKESYGQMGLTAFCAAGLFLLLFGILDLYPAGGGSILMTDLYSQYAPLLYRFYDVVTGTKNPFLDFFVSGGANLYADTVNELANPVNYLLLLFGRDRIYLALNLLFLCYGVLSALSAHLFLLRCWPDRRRWNTALSLCYAFSGYFAYNFQIIKWMLFPVLFPLFALALLRLVRKGKGGLYALLLAWQLVLSIQLGFMSLLFVLFPEGCTLSCWCEGGAGGAAGTAGLVYAGGNPSVRNRFAASFRILLSSSRAGENLSWMGVMKRHGLDDLFERLFQIAQPALMALLVFGGIRALRRRERGKKPSADLRFLLALNGFLWLTVLLERQIFCGIWDPMYVFPCATLHGAARPDQPCQTADAGIRGTKGALSEGIQRGMDSALVRRPRNDRLLHHGIGADPAMAGEDRPGFFFFGNQPGMPDGNRGGLRDHGPVVCSGAVRPSGGHATASAIHSGGGGLRPVSEPVRRPARGFRRSAGERGRPMRR